MNNLENEQLTLYEGQDRTFSLNGKEFTIPARLDAFNYYRNKFRELAIYYTDKASKEYKESVCNLDTFLDKTVDIYIKNLHGVVDKVIDILVSDNIFECSDEVFIDTHKNISCLAMEYCAEIEEQHKQLLETSASSVQGISNVAGSLLGKKSWILGEFISGIGEGMAENVSLSEEQAKTLFESIEPHKMFNHTYTDYWKVHITLVFFLQRNNRDIWAPNEVAHDEVDTTIKLLARPNFPQDKTTDLILDLVTKDPYRKEIYDLMREKFGDTEEVLNIVDYFGFTNYTENIYMAEDFPKVEMSTETPTECIGQGNVNEQTSSETQEETTSEQGATETTTGKKGLLSFVDKLDNEKVKKGLKIGAGIVAAGAVLNVLGNSSSNSSSSSSNDDLIKYMEKKDRDAKHQAALESQRNWNAVNEANKERRRKGQPELPLPPRTWY